MVTSPDHSIARIQTVRNGRLEPLIPRAPLRSSAVHSDWRGMLLEEHHADMEYVRPDLRSRSTLLHIFTGVAVRHEWRVGGQTHRFHSPPGSMLIVPEGFEGSVRAWRSRPGIQWILEFEPRLLQRRLEECGNDAPVELAPHFDLTDPQMLRLIQTLHADVVGGSPVGSLFGETIGAALALHLVQNYAVSSARPAPAGGLGERSLNRVLEYIHANLGSDLHLKELADIADLSAFHFAKLFKRSTGRSPHQYVLQQRLECAKALLRNRHIGLSEVSLRAGFSDQSHLSNVFRRFVGLTPSRFRALSL